jgi:hypothetical protein
MSKKDDPRQDETTSNCPDGVSLGRFLLGLGRAAGDPDAQAMTITQVVCSDPSLTMSGRRRCQGAYMDGVSRWKGIEPLSRQRYPVHMAQHGEAVRALLIEDFLEDVRED